MPSDPDTSFQPNQTERDDTAARSRQPVVTSHGGNITIDGSVSGTGIAIGHRATAIVTIYQQILRPVPYNFRSGIQRMVEDYTAIFGGRDTELARLDDFLTQDDRPFALLIAPTGRGKTALLIHWIARLQQTHPEWRVVFAPISIRYQTANEQVALGLLAHTLAETHNDLEQFRSYDQSPASLRAIVGDYLRRPLPGDVRLLVVLDGIDEATSWQMSSELFPHTPGPRLKLVVSARTMAHRSRTNWYRDLGFAQRLTCDLELEGLGQAAVHDMLRQMGGPLNTLATDVYVLAEIERVSQGDPVTIRLLIELLQDGKIRPEQLANLPADDVNAVYDLWLKNLRKHEREHERVYALLSLVATAYGPLTTMDLLRLDGASLREPRDVEDAARAVARFVIGNGTPDQGYVFSHQKLREVYREQRLGTAQQAMLHQRFVQYGKAWYADRSQPLPDYLCKYWVTHLAQAQEWTTLRTVLVEIVPTGAGAVYIQPWADARSKADSSYGGYLADLDVLWQWADAQHNIALQVRCALIAASIRSLSSGLLTPELLLRLVTVGTPEGRWSSSVVLEHISQMSDPEQRTESLKHLVRAGVVLPWSRALEVVVAIDYEKFRSSALSALVPYLPRDLLPAALEVAYAITDDEARSYALSALVPHLTLIQQSTALAAALDAAANTQETERVKALSCLAPHLSQKLLLNAIEATTSIKEVFFRAKALSVLAPHLAPDQQPAVLAVAIETAHKIPNPVSRVEMLSIVAPHLRLSERGAVLTTALEAALTIRDERNRGYALSLLAPHLPLELLTVALDAATTITDEYICASILRLLALHLPPEQQPDALAAALDAATHIRNASFRLEALDRLAPHLPPKLQSVASAAMLAAAAIIMYEDYRVEARTYSARYMPRQMMLAAAAANMGANELARALSERPLLLPPELLPAMLSAAATIKARYRPEALSELAINLPPDQQTALLTAALDAAASITEAEYRAKALSELAARLPPELRCAALTAALEAATAIRAPYTRIEALTSLVPQLPSNQQPEALAIALKTSTTISDADVRTKILVSIALHLPPDQQAEAIAAALEAAVAITAVCDPTNELHYGGPTFLSPDKESDLIDVEIENAVTIALSELAPYLPLKLLPVAFDAATNITREQHRAEALTGLAPYLPPKFLLSALNATAKITQELYRFRALHGLVRCLPPDQQLATLTAALDAAANITQETERAKALTELAPHVPPELLPWMLDAAANIRDTKDRAEALLGLAPYLLPDEQSTVLAVALKAAAAIPQETERVKALTKLASHLPLELLPSALDAATNIRDTKDRAEALLGLAPYLLPQLLPVALHTTITITDEYYRAKVLRGLAPYLPSELLLGALDAAINITHDYWRAMALSALAPYLLPDQQAAVLTTLLKAVAAISNGAGRAAMLIELAPHLPLELLPAALDTAATTPESNRAKALRGLAPYLPPTLLLTAIEAANSITDPFFRAESLIGLAPHLPPDRQSAVLAAALDATASITHPGKRAMALWKLAPHLPPDRQSAVLATALDATASITQQDDCAKVICELTPHLSSALLPTALEVAATIKDARYRTRALRALAQQFATVLGNLESQSLTILRTLSRRGRPNLLSDLTALLPWIDALAEQTDDINTLAEIRTAIVETSHCWP